MPTWYMRLERKSIVICIALELTNRIESISSDMMPWVQVKITRISLKSAGARSVAQMLSMKFHRVKLTWEIGLPVETKLPAKASLVFI